MKISLKRTVRIASAVIALSILASAVPSALATTTYTFSDYIDFSSASPYSLRGLALSSNGQDIYTGFIHPTSGVTEEYSTSLSSPPVTNPTSLASSTNLTGGQPKGVATDAQGWVFVTENNSNGSNTQKFVAFDPSLNAKGVDPNSDHETTITFPGTNKEQLSGISAQNVNGTNYIYVSSNKGNDSYITRYSYTYAGSGSGAYPTNFTLDTSFGTNGFLSIKTLTGDSNAFVNGIEVAPDGSIYAAGGLTVGANSTAYGDTVFKISPNGSSYTTASVAGAMDVALVNNGDVYVTQYINNEGSGVDSNIVALKQSNLQSDSNVVFNIPSALQHQYTVADSGFSGIDVTANGTVYMADQISNKSGSDYDDRILVAAPIDFASVTVPAPAACMGGIGLLGLIGLNRRSRK